ncbi:MAG: phosphonopyruvate decarboxylase [Treponema sp.]|nr:phosphonopyruvate decarboxylase [Treponema sp.]
MIDPQFFLNQLDAHGTDFFTGVPDSLLKSFCAFVTDNSGTDKHIIAVNEGAAVALAAGYHLASGKIPLVYMQNSGIGNAVNPLLSLAGIYRLPMVLLIGWRGEPDTEFKDEPQHYIQGKVTCALFDAMEIPYIVLSDNENDVKTQIDKCYAKINADKTPYALIVRKDTFSSYTLSSDAPPDVNEKMTREEAIEEIILSSSEKEVFISTTGMASRELFELRNKYNTGHERDFLTVGSMGHASSIALAAALTKKDRPVTCIDGDGAALMHLGSLAAIGERKPQNLRHIVLNNGAHDSVGGQPTIAQKINLCAVARGCGYKSVYLTNNKYELRHALRETQINSAASCDIPDESKGPFFIEVIVRKGGRKDLGRPDITPEENKKMFMQFLDKGK